jgi:hypothetical protein
MPSDKSHSKRIALVPKIQSAIEQTNQILFNEFTEKELIVFNKGMDKLIQKIKTLPEPEFIIEVNQRTSNTN